MKRRSFLAGILALGMAPAVVKASSIMRVRPLLVPEWVLGPEMGPAPIEIFTGEIGRVEGITWNNAGQFADQQIREAIAAMRRQHIPPGRDGKYIVFVHPSNIEWLRG